MSQYEMREINLATGESVYEILGPVTRIERLRLFKRSIPGDGYDEKDQAEECLRKFKENEK